MSKLKIEYRSVVSLVPYAKNARTHSDHQVRQIAESIVEFGFNNPVLIDKNGEIIAGHGRVLAAQTLGMQQVPTVCLGHLSDRQKRAYVLADNKIALNSGWDFETLSNELAELAQADFDLSLTGFNEQELDALLKADIGVLPEDFIEGERVVEVAGHTRIVGKTKDGLTDDDEVPDEPQLPVSVLGDVWVLGKHRVMCGDSLSETDMRTLMDGSVADMWLTDPPYNVDYTGATKDNLKILNDSMDDNSFRSFLSSCFNAANNVMKPGAVFYIWHADSEGYNFRGACRDVGWKVRQCLIWKKNALVLGRQDYHWIHEPCLYGWKDGAGHKWNNDRKQTTVLEFNRPNRNAEHPTMKPVELFLYQLQNNTEEGDVVLDSFGWSGTTLICAEKCNRVARVMELDPKYCDVIVKRWQEFTGLEAVHSSGKSFSQIQEDRCE